MKNVKKNSVFYSSLSYNKILFIETIIQNCKKDGAPYYVLCIGLLKELASERKKNQKEEKHKAELESRFSYNIFVIKQG